MPPAPHSRYMKCSIFLSLVLLSRITLLCCALSIASQDIRQLLPGSTLRGTTKNALHLLHLGSAYRSGQVYFNLTTPSFPLAGPRLPNEIVQVTTCSDYTQFDTALFAYAGNLLEAQENSSRSIKPIDANDNDCEKKSTLELMMSPGQSVFILLTGFGLAEGQYEIRANFLTRSESIPLPWGLDRIDQRSLPLNGRYSVTKGGHGTYVYVLDSGVRISHTEFQNEDGSGRAIFGTDVVERLQYAVDGNGHGTHVAAIIGGRNVGVAKRVLIVSVRVLDRNGIGYIARLTEGLDWALEDLRKKNRSPAVFAMSLSTPRSQALNDAVARITEAGIPVVTAAGNSKFDSCLFSPASESSAITVASTNRDDTHSQFSNFGGCVDIYAPGEQIYSAWHTGDHAMKNLSGTSAACPHVVGTVASLLSDNPSLTPFEVSSVINTTATKAAVDTHVYPTNSSYAVVAENVTDDANKLLYIRPLPTLLNNPKPERSEMFIYAVFRLTETNFSAFHCHLTSEVNDQITQLIEFAVSTPENAPTVAIALCCLDLDLADCDTDAPSGSSRIVLRVKTRDHHASSVFKRLEAMSSDDGALGELGLAVHATVNVLYEPWVVDSRGYKYWTAPSLEEIKRGPLSAAQVVLVGCGGCILAVFLTAAVFCVVQRRKEKRIESEKEEFERQADEYEQSKEKVSNLTTIENDPTAGFRREGIKRQNTDLFGDVLRNISASAGLITPRFFGGLMTPRQREVERSPFSLDGQVTAPSSGGNPFREMADVSNIAKLSRDGSMTASSSALKATDPFTPQSIYKPRGLGSFSSFYNRAMGTPHERDRGRPPVSNRPASTMQPVSMGGRRGPWETGRILSYGPGQEAVVKSSVAGASSSPASSSPTQQRDQDAGNTEHGK